MSDKSAEKHAEGGKKGFPWEFLWGGFLVLILVVGFAFPWAGSGIAGFFLNLHPAWPDIDRSIATFMRLVGIAIVIAIVIAIFRATGDKKEEHH